MRLARFCRLPIVRMSSAKDKFCVAGRLKRSCSTRKSNANTLAKSRLPKKNKLALKTIRSQRFKRLNVNRWNQKLTWTPPKNLKTKQTLQQRPKQTHGKNRKQKPHDRVCSVAANQSSRILSNRKHLSWKPLQKSICPRRTTRQKLLRIKSQTR